MRVDIKHVDVFIAEINKTIALNMEYRYFSYVEVIVFADVTW